MRPFYRLKVITPQGTVYEGEVAHALIPAEDGFVGVLANHAPYITSSEGGRLELLERSEELKKFKVGPGFFEVSGNQAAFLTQAFGTV